MSTTVISSLHSLHRRMRTTGLAALLVFCIAAPAIAQDSTQIRFNDAIRIALDQNTTLKRASNEVDRADAQLWAERMDFAPTTSLSMGASRSFGRSFSQEEGGVVNQTTDFLTGDLNANLTVFDGFANVASLRRAKAQSTASELSLSRTRQDVVFQVMDRYITLVERREIVRVQQEELEARRQQLRQIEEFVDVGSRPVSALYEQQAAVAEAESNVLTAQRDVQLAETRLMQTLRLDPMEAYNFQAPPLASDTLIAEPYDMQTLMQEAFDRRLDLRAARSDVDAAEQGTREARSAYYPTISIGAQWGTDWSSRAPDQQITFTDEQTVNLLTQEGVTVPTTIPDGQQEITTFDFLDKLDSRRGGSFSVRLSFPIFDGLRREQQIEEAKVSEQNARYALEDQKLQIALEVREAYLNYQTAAKQLEVTAKQLRSARQAREAAQERYNLGAASIVELTNANRTFIQAASQRVRARYSFIFQQKLIDYYTGILEPQPDLFQ